MIRRRLIVSAVAVTAIAGEWLGHSISYFRVAGVAGLQAGLGGGLHDYMWPLAALLLAAAAVGATVAWRAWLALGRRLDSSATLLARVRRGEPPGHAPGATTVPGSASLPSPLAQVLAVGLPLAALQCLIFLAQENLERVIHGLAGVGAGPLLDAGGAGLWIQAAIALVLAAAMVVSARLFASRQRTVARIEHRARALWLRARRAVQAAARPATPDIPTAHLELRSALWQRPPPRPSTA